MYPASTRERPDAVLDAAGGVWFSDERESVVDDVFAENLPILHTSFGRDTNSVCLNGNAIYHHRTDADAF